MIKNILFYYPSNKRSVQIETTLIELKKRNHKIALLTSCESGDLHQFLENEGISTYTYVISKNIFYYFKQIYFLVRFCKNNKIDVVFANLQHSNFIASIAQFFMSVRVITFRHHFKFNKGNFGIPLKVNKNEKLFDSVINRLAKTIVVPSLGVYNGMAKYEKVNMDKVRIIPYAYNFDLYKQPIQQEVDKIKEKYNAHLRIIMIARLIPFKRHQLMLPLFKKIINEGLDIQVLIMDEGPEQKNLEAYITNNQLTERIHLLGFQRNILDYMASADLLIHPSLTEASNNVVKEIGLLKKAVCVCRGVGDFDEYIVDQENGFLMNTETPQLDAEKVIKKVYNQKEMIEYVGENLRETILNNFNDNQRVMNQYDSLINNNELT